MILGWSELKAQMSLGCGDCTDVNSPPGRMSSFDAAFCIVISDVILKIDSAHLALSVDHHHRPMEMPDRSSNSSILAINVNPRE